MLARRVEHAPAEHERTQVGERSGHEVPTEYQDSTLQVRDSRQIWTGVSCGHFPAEAASWHLGRVQRFGPLRSRTVRHPA